MGSGPGHTEHAASPPRRTADPPSRPAAAHPHAPRIRYEEEPVVNALLVCAGALGALCRYELGGWLHRRTGSTAPVGTAAVNLIGAAALALLTASPLGAGWQRVLGTGFLGGFTTFSTWMVETTNLAREGGRRGVLAAAANLLGMLVAGVLAVAVVRRLV